GVELDQLGERGRQAGWMDDPAEAPTRHEKAFREAMHDDELIVAIGNVEKARSAGCAVAEIDAFVDFVGDDPGSGAAAMRQHVLLLVAAESPAGRVVG